MASMQWPTGFHSYASFTREYFRLDPACIPQHHKTVAAITHSAIDSDCSRAARASCTSRSLHARIAPIVRIVVFAGKHTVATRDDIVE